MLKLSWNPFSFFVLSKLRHKFFLTETTSDSFLLRQTLLYVHLKPTDPLLVQFLASPSK